MPDTPETPAPPPQPPPVPPPALGEGEATPALAPPSGRRPFRELRRELSEQDFNSPGVGKLLLDELDESIAECSDFRGYVPKYYEAERARAVLEERLNGQARLDAERLHGRVSGDIVFGSGVAVGSGLLGFVPSLPENLQWPFSILGLVLIVGSAIAKALRP